MCNDIPDVDIDIELTNADKFKQMIKKIYERKTSMVEVKIDTLQLVNKLKELTCSKCGKESWQCYECEIKEEIKCLVKEFIKDIHFDVEK